MGASSRAAEATCRSMQTAYGVRTVSFESEEDNSDISQMIDAVYDCSILGMTVIHYFHGEVVPVQLSGE